MGQQQVFNPIEAAVKQAKEKVDLENQVKEANNAMKDIQGPLESYRPGMVVANNQAAFFTLPNYLGNVTILNIGAKDVQVFNVNSIKYGKDVSISLKNVTGQDTIVNAFQGPPLQIPNLVGGNKMWTVNVTAAPVPKIVPVSSTYEECIYSVENKGFIPTVTWGSTPPDKQDASCDQKLCDYWPKKYPNGIPPMYQASARNCPVVNNNVVVAANGSGVKINQGNDTTAQNAVRNAVISADGSGVKINQGNDAVAQSQVVKSANTIAPVQLDNASTVQLTTVKSNDNREWECRPIGSNFPEKPLECPPVDVTCSPCEKSYSSCTKSETSQDNIKVNIPKKKKKKSKKSKKSSKKILPKVAQKDVINQMLAGKKQSNKSEPFTETFINLQDDYCYLNLVIGLLIIAIVLHMKGVFQ